MFESTPEWFDCLLVQMFETYLKHFPEPLSTILSKPTTGLCVQQIAKTEFQGIQQNHYKNAISREIYCELLSNVRV